MKKESKGLELETDILEGIEAKVEGSKIIFKKGEVSVERDFNTRCIRFEVAGSKLKISAPRATKMEKKLAGSVQAHARNMMKGLLKDHIYKLKICPGHFPMNVSVSGSDFVIKNFLGERMPRALKLREGVSVKVEGSDVVVKSINKELAGQTAASIEKLTRIKRRDLTRFQDGIYITEKDGKPV
jgi:large subunit ribosomal protein L6